MLLVSAPRKPKHVSVYTTATIDRPKRPNSNNPLNRSPLTAWPPWISIAHLTVLRERRGARLPHQRRRRRALGAIGGGDERAGVDREKRRGGGADSGKVTSDRAARTFRFPVQCSAQIYFLEEPTTPPVATCCNHHHPLGSVKKKSSLAFVTLLFKKYNFCDISDIDFGWPREQEYRTEKSVLAEGPALTCSFNYGSNHYQLTLENHNLFPTTTGW